MITFCKRAVHSFLCLPNSKDVNQTVKPPSRCRNIPTPMIAGLSFIAEKTEIQRPTNVIESSTILKSKSTSSFTTTTTTTGAAIPAEIMMKKDAGGIGFIDDVGGEVNGLMSCTESLGFESSDERRTDEQIEEMNINQEKELCSLGEQKWSMRRRKTTALRREVKKFPPPLSSLNKNGQPNFFLRAVRKNGRLELTEIRIDRPEILRASRQDGRLTLHLIQTVEEDEEEVEEIEEEEREEEKIEEVEERSGEWMFPVSNGSGDGFRRCHELVNRHHLHHNNLQVWSQQCVTST